VVVALAVGWFVTARIGNGDALAQGSAPATAVTTTAGPSPDRAVLELLPGDAQCRDQDRSTATVHCVLAGIDVDYRRVTTRAVAATYRATIGMHRTPAGSIGAPACARGGQEERAWSRPDTPRRVAGRYACRVEQGRAAMWWTVDDRGLLAHAIASNGDLASLFAWWSSHSER
jgi:hypothetical protein